MNQNVTLSSYTILSDTSSYFIEKLYDRNLPSKFLLSQDENNVLPYIRTLFSINKGVRTKHN